MLSPSSHARSCLCAALPLCGAEMFHEMGDIGLKPVVVYHNLRCWEGGLHSAQSSLLHTHLPQGQGRAPCSQARMCLPSAVAGSAWLGSRAPSPRRLSPCFAASLPPHLCSVPELYEHALKYEPSTHIVGAGALATLSGAKTGRSPK